ncbi:MAG: CxxxxCH/CxxCH domain-containing protein [Anaeromyxobacter sp.]
MSSIRRLALPAAILALLAGCDQARPIAGVDPADPGGVSARCTSCHGDASRDEVELLVKAAPPATVSGASAGAHLAHLHGGTFRNALACADCHVVPQSTGHADGAIEVRFGALAKAGDTTPSWSGDTCTVYCHGATLGASGASTTPRWDGGALDCGSCHGAPPPSHDPASTRCATCHPGTVKADGTIDLANGMHIDGKLEVSSQHPDGWANPAQHGPAAKQDLPGCQACHGADLDGGTSGVSCNACHGGTAWQSNCTFCHGAKLATYTAGDLAKAAPPRGAGGETDGSARAVGAHQAHLVAGVLSRAVACAECHASVPTSLAHVDGATTLSWGTLARGGGAAPSWNGTSCANYCHGATLGAGGTNHAPAWTGGAAQAACGTCHGAPPPAPHAQDTSCGSCHTGYTATSVNAATHIDGHLDVSALSCTSCHGDATRTSNPAAPPRGTHGETATTARAVGAHQAHLAGNAIARAVACTECHAVPSSPSHSSGAVDMSWGTLARGGGVAPSWNGTTCANYCHGATLGAGGTNHAPAWTGGAAQAACGTCHGAPPPAPHVCKTASWSWCNSRTDCGTCHAGYTGSTTNLTTHVDGALQSATTCQGCHATAALTSRHRRSEHVSRSCGDCHPGYTASAVNATTHRDGTAEVGNRITSFNTATRTCTSSCHGSETW